MTSWRNIDEPGALENWLYDHELRAVKARVAVAERQIARIKTAITDFEANARKQKRARAMDGKRGQTKVIDAEVKRQLRMLRSPTTVNGQQGWGTSYYQTGQNCYGGGQGIYEDREVETVDYVPKERKGTRTVYETVSVTKRTATYGSSVSAVVRVPGREINVKFDSMVEASDEAFSAPLSKHFAIFQDTNEANLIKEAAAKARNELQRFAKAAIRCVKADERRAALPTASEAEKAGILTDLAVLESGVSSADVVDYLKATTKQSAATLALALNDKRIAIAPSYLAATLQTEMAFESPTLCAPLRSYGTHMKLGSLPQMGALNCPCTETPPAVVKENSPATSVALTRVILTVPVFA
jgi:hypothetical protein